MIVAGTPMGAIMIGSGAVRRHAERADPSLVLLFLLATVVPPLFVVLGDGPDRTPVMAAMWGTLAALHLGFALLSHRLGGPLWRVLSMAGIIWAAGDLWQVGLAFADPADPANWEGSFVQSLALLVGMSVTITVLLRHPAGRRVGLRLDAATTMAGAITAGMLLVQLPSGVRNVAWLLELGVALLIQPGVFLVAVFAVTRLLLAGRSPFTAATGMAFGAAATVQAVLQAFPVQTYGQPREGAWMVAGNVLASTLLVIGIRCQQMATRDRRSARAAKANSRLPYGAMTLTWSLSLVTLVVQGLTWRSWLVLIGTGVTTLLVVARQAVAYRHVAVLLGERDALAAKLTEQAFHDALTGLGNRALFMRRLTGALTRGPVTVFLIDLDEFKPVNDSFGHATGDRLLVEVADRLRRCVRAGDTVARLGGDEFAVLVEDLDPARRAEVATALADRLSGHVRLGEVEVPLSASIGMASGRHDPDSLLHAADMAMYDEKNAARLEARIGGDRP